MAGAGVERTVHWECRLCEATEADLFIGRHLANAHEWDFDAKPAEVRLHASKDGPDWSENTMGYWHGDLLLGIVVLRREREADDPMRFDGG